MHLVDEDGTHTGEIAIALQPPEEDTCRAEEESSALRSHALQSDRVSHRVADPLCSLLRYSIGHSHGGDSSRLGTYNVAPRSLPSLTGVLIHDLRQLRGLATPCFTRYNGHLVFPDRPYDPLSHFEGRKSLSLPQHLLEGTVGRTFPEQIGFQPRAFSRFHCQGRRRQSSAVPVTMDDV